jgi:hypothetical protein
MQELTRISKYRMATYLFETSEFGVSDSGIHLLRSGFNYQTIRWTEINSIKIEKGKELHNWAIILMFGLVIFIVGIYLSIRTIDILIHKDNAVRNAKMILFLLIPCVGAYFVYNSLQTGTLLRINYSAYKKLMFPLKEIEGKNGLVEFRSLMTEKLGGKIRVPV